MSQVADLFAPTAQPASERAAPKTRTADRDDAPRFSDKLESERAESQPSQPRDRGQSERAERGQSEKADDTASTSETAEADNASAPASEDTDVATAQTDEDAPAVNTADLPAVDLLSDQPVAEDPLASLIDALHTVDAETVNEALTVTALTGETIPLTPPQATGQADPGALGRWFAQASGPVETATAQSNALLNQLRGQAGQQQPANTAGDPSLAALTADGSPPATTPSFADALANSAAMDSTMSGGGLSGESLDALVTQAMAKASANLEPGTASTPTVTTGQTVATGAQAAMTAVPQAATGQAVPVTALAVEVNRQAMNGKTQFDIRLDPPELGRLNVRLEMDSTGQTRTHMVVERAETLEMLTTDARNLERALQQAGLKTEPGSVSFELAQDATDGFTQDQQSAGTDDQPSDMGAEDASPLDADDPSLTEAAASPEAIRQQLYVTGHLDVRI